MSCLRVQKIIKLEFLKIVMTNKLCETIYATSKHWLEFYRILCNSAMLKMNQIQNQNQVQITNPDEG